jgi:hypothetical protein
MGHTCRLRFSKIGSEQQLHVALSSLAGFVKRFGRRRRFDRIRREDLIRECHLRDQKIGL